MFLEALNSYYRSHDTHHAIEMSLLEEVLPTYFADQEGHPAIQALSYGETPLPLGVELLDWAGLNPEDTFLDLGCGCGALVLLAASRCRRAVGVDLSPTAIQFARAAAQKFQILNAEFHQQDLLKTDLSSHDLIYCCPTAVSPWLVQQFSANLPSCRPGARILTVTHPLPGVPLLDRRSHRFSWCQDRYIRNWEFYLHKAQSQEV